jgi:hypothetical protein
MGADVTFAKSHTFFRTFGVKRCVISELDQATFDQVDVDEDFNATSMASKLRQMLSS